MSKAEIEQCVDELVSIPCTGGQTLSAILSYPPKGRAQKMIVIAGPHPFLGGVMDNIVVRNLAQTMADGGWVVLRFDCSKPPDSEIAEHLDTFWSTGHAPDDGLKQAELEAVLRWANGVAPVQCLAGYSFGSWLVGCSSANFADIPQLVFIAPTMDKHDFSTMNSCACRKMVILPSSDFSTPLETARKQLESWPEPCTVEVLENTDHFLRQEAGDVAKMIFDWLQEGIESEDQ